MRALFVVALLIVVAVPAMAFQTIYDPSTGRSMYYFPNQGIISVPSTGAIIPFEPDVSDDNRGVYVRPPDMRRLPRLRRIR